MLERLVCKKQKGGNIKDEIALLTILIEKWEADHIISTGMDPVQLLRSLMKDHHLKSQDLVDILGISKGYVSDILNYKKAFSKQVIRKLATYFKVSQEAFNRPYALGVRNSNPRKNTSVLHS